ncbi:RedB protein (plasmid) [Tundrisphaera sp. TA3]|uniref:RedB protein n=1 Tax=Tundrisphaera sp. TA3 TaxID=3435775 RepID=UPI003EBCD940
MPRRSPTRWAAATVAIALWLGMVAAGFRAIEVHETTAGDVGRVPASWPDATTLDFVPRRPNVLMAVHPRCPCTRASLDLLLAGTRGMALDASIRLLVYRPEDATPDWGGASVMPFVGSGGGAAVVDDPGGREAATFGLVTSGAVAAYDGEGRLRFSGGLTAVRGRDIPSRGAEALGSVLSGRDPSTGSSSVFGCGMAAASCLPAAGRSGP